MWFKIFFLFLFIIYQTNLYSKATDKNEFNHKYLSSYFSALISFDNDENDKAIKFFNSSKYLLNKHDKFLRKYVISLVFNDQVAKAIQQIKYSKNNKSAEFFEANVLLVIDAMKKKKFEEADKLIKNLEIYKENGNIEYIIYETLYSYNNLFIKKKISENQKKFGKLTLVNFAFQNCYLKSEKTNFYFKNLINSADGNYSRYSFFYLQNLIQNGEVDLVKEETSLIDPLNSTLLISQVKKWIDQSKFQKLDEYFLCKNESDLIAEFFFLISNLYSSENLFEKSNFYLKISYFLNPKFYFNLSLLVENHFIVENYKLSRKILEKMPDKEEIYTWYKTKKIAQIISKENSKEQSLNFIENNFKKIKKPSNKIIYDMANVYKSNKKYYKAISYYSLLLSKIDINSEMYPEILYRRGGSYERIKNFTKADEDLLESLKINPDDPYVLNYLAYSWLERNYKVREAIKMLETAYKENKDDPYIIDSVGWGYFLIGNYKTAETYLKQAVELMPDDPIVNDHYGDILWKLNRKLQAKYFWENVLKLESTEEEMKKNIYKKLLNGLEKV